MTSHIKRRRAAIACNACRARKIRCDGNVPICGRCHEVGSSCVYDHLTDKRKPPSKRYVEALLSRIKNLEHELQQYQSAGTAIPANSGNHELSTQILGTSELDAATITSPLENSTSDEDDDLVADLTRLYGHLDIAEDGQLRYFGAPSYFNLLKRPQYQAIDSSLSSYQEYNLMESGLSSELQDHLLDLFWTWQNPWQYVIHKEVFCHAFARGAYTDYCTPLLLQTILALASRYSDRSELRDSTDQCSTAGNALAEQAKAMLLFEVERPTVATVAALLLLSLREMAVNKEALGWTYVGMAIRIAYNLGLNHDCTEWLEQGRITEDDAEIRKVTFWACYMFDKLFTVGLGRPGMIQLRDVTVPKPTLLQEMEFAIWEYKSPNVQGIASPSRSVSNLHFTCSIFEIACETLDEIWAPNSKLTLAEKEAKAGKAYTELEHTYNDLPSFMRLTSSPRVIRAAHHYSFHLQYFSTVILLHRPFLRSHKEHDPLDKLTFDLSAHHHRVCTFAADKISSIMKLYQSSYTLRTIPISAIHCVGNASIIQLLNAKSRDVAVSQKAIRLLRFNIQCLQEMSKAWMWSQRAAQCIQIMAEDWSIGGITDPQVKVPTEGLNTSSIDANIEASDPATCDVLTDLPGAGVVSADNESYLPDKYWDNDGVDWAELAASWNPAWLMQVDSQDMNLTADSWAFGDYLHPTGLNDQEQ